MYLEVNSKLYVLKEYYHAFTDKEYLMPYMEELCMWMTQTLLLALLVVNASSKH